MFNFQPIVNSINHNDSIKVVLERNENHATPIQFMVNKLLSMNGSHNLVYACFTRLSYGVLEVNLRYSSRVNQCNNILVVSDEGRNSTFKGFDSISMEYPTPNKYVSNILENMIYYGGDGDTVTVFNKDSEHVKELLSMLCLA